MKREHIHKIFSNIPTIRTERLVLRKMSLDDTDDMYEYAKRSDVTLYLTWSPHAEKAYTFQYLKYLQTRYRAGDFYDWAICDKESGKMIGTCGFTRFDFPNDAAEIGYVINPDYAGRGLATEAVEAIIAYGFKMLSLNRIECRFIPENVASRRVMEKNGMIFEGIRRKGMLIKGRYCDIGICSILKEEYEKRSAEF